MLTTVVLSILSLTVILPNNCHGADTSKVVEKLRQGIDSLEAANATLNKLVQEMQTAPKDKLPELQQQAVKVLKELQNDIAGGAGQLGQVGSGVAAGPLSALYTALKSLLDSLSGLFNEAVVSVNPDNVVGVLSSVVTNLLNAAEKVLKFVTTTLQGSAADLTQGVSNVIEGALAVPNNIILNFIKLLADLTSAAGGINSAKRMALVN